VPEIDEVRPKVFISGAPRSGTSILLLAMKEVFDLPGHGESHVLPAINAMIHAFYEYKAAYNGVDRSTREQLMLNKVSLMKIKLPLFSYIRELYQGSFPQGGWVDKTPAARGIYALKIAEEIFADARLIATKRTGTEVVASHMIKFGSSFEEACDIWVSAMVALNKVQPQCKRLLIVDQYDFSNAGSEVASSIAVHIGVPDKAGELARFLADKRAEGSSTHDWSRRLRLADMPWCASQREMFRQKCSEMMNVYGYEI
jgi:Sulfotransferase family